MILDKLIKDIISLKEELNTVEDNATYENQYDWYQWAIPMGLIEYEYMGDKLVGFLEWMRLDYIPEDRNKVPLDYSQVLNGPIGFINNCGTTCAGVLKRLIKKAQDKNKDCKIYCWDRKKAGKFLIFRRS